MRPVGVGFQSPGPTGAVGFTITAHRSLRPASATIRSDATFERL